MESIKRIKESFVSQQDQSDCGVACLLSVIRFHGGDNTLENLRKISGTSKQGTSMLGLLQAAKQLGLEAEGIEAENIENLGLLDQPTLLHVIVENNLAHYVVYYPTSEIDNDHILLGDPAKGIIEITKEQLNSIWQSKTLLKVTTNTSFEKGDTIKRKKKTWLINLIKDDFPILLVSLFLGICFSVLSITTSIFSQKLIDDILPKEDIKKFWLSLILVTALMLIRSLIGYIRSMFIAQQALSFNNRITESFYKTILGLPKSFFDSRKIGELLSRISDTRRIQSVLSSVLGSIVIDFLVIVISLGFVFTYSLTIGFILLGALPIYFLMLIRYNNPINIAQKEVMIGNALSESNFIDTMQGVVDIKILNKQSFFEGLNFSIYGEFQRRIFSLNKIQFRFGFVSEVTGVLLVIAVFGISSWLVISKQLKLGEMVALISIASNVVPSVNHLVISNIQIQEALVAFDRMFEFTSMDNEETIKENKIDLLKNPIESLILKNISFRFPGSRQTLRDISFVLRKGEMVAMLGESGGGKSTLLQLIQKFYTQETGAITVDDVDLREINHSDWRKKIGTVQQDIKIFNGSVIYNITLSDKPEDYKRAFEFCEQKGLSRYFNELPQSYLTLLGEEGVNISGGQKQLVALARALFHEPQILLLDEATSAMDKNTEGYVLSLLKNESKNKIVLMVTHRSKVARSCDKIFMLENGVISQPNELTFEEI
jgi:ABC-type bacteriocin/lantibiotic exporter with double-glycine peptidase domain